MNIILFNLLIVGCLDYVDSTKLLNGPAQSTTALLKLSSVDSFLISPNLYWMLGTCVDGSNNKRWMCVHNGESIVSEYYGHNDMSDSQPAIINTITNTTVDFMQGSFPDEYYLQIIAPDSKWTSLYYIVKDKMLSTIHITNSGKLMAYDSHSNIDYSFSQVVRSIAWIGGTYTLKYLARISGEVASSLSMDTNKPSMNQSVIIGSKQIIDSLSNSNGGATISYTKTITSTRDRTISTSYTKTNEYGFKLGFSAEMSVELEFGIARQTTKFSFNAEFSFSHTDAWTDSDSSTTSESQQTSLNVIIPSGYLANLYKSVNIIQTVYSTTQPICFCYPTMSKCKFIPNTISSSFITIESNPGYSLELIKIV